MPVCSGRELIMDLSLDMNETILAVLRECNAEVEVVRPLPFRLDANVQFSEVDIQSQQSTTADSECKSVLFVADAFG